MSNRWQNSIYGVVGVVIGVTLSHFDQYHFGDRAQILQSMHSMWSHMWPAAIGAICVAVPFKLYQSRRDYRMSLNSEVKA